MIQRYSCSDPLPPLSKVQAKISPRSPPLGFLLIEASATHFEACPERNVLEKYCTSTCLPESTKEVAATNAHLQTFQLGIVIRSNPLLQSCVLVGTAAIHHMPMRCLQARERLLENACMSWVSCLRNKHFGALSLLDWHIL